MRSFNRRQHLILGLLVILVVMMSSGCATYSGHAFSLQDSLVDRTYDQAYQGLMEKNEGSDSVLDQLNAGVLMHLAGEYELSNQHLQSAKRAIEALHGVSLSESLGSLVINDGFVAYKGAPHEQLLLHLYMAMNYIMLEQLGAARVEMMQADVKMREWRDEPDDDPLLRYFAGIVYEALGEYDSALVAYRFAYDAYKVDSVVQNIPIPEELIIGMSRMMSRLGLDDELDQLRQTHPGIVQDPYRNRSPNMVAEGELVVLIGQGLAPVKRENAITTYAHQITRAVRIAVPVYRRPEGRLMSARIRLADGAIVPLETVQNIDALARHALQQELPLITSRAIARAVIKYNNQNQAKEQSAVGGLLLSVGNLLTERADTRSWVTLPRVFQLARSRLPAGEHQITLEFTDEAGNVRDIMVHDVKIEEAKVRFLFAHRHGATRRSERDVGVTTTVIQRNKATVIQIGGER